MSVRGELRAAAAAMTFLTRLPMAGIVAHDADDLRGSLAYFPVVGILVGIVSGLVFALAARLWPTVLATFVCIGATVLITGAFHEDALADALDGFGGGWSANQVLEIMKDSRVGSYALVGMVLVIGIKVFALAAIFGAARENAVLTVGRALVAAHVLGRWSSVVLIASLPYVRVATPGARAPTGAAFSAAASRGRVVAATLIAIGCVVLVLEWRAIPVLVATALVMFLAGRYFVRRIGGITGDALGALNQVVELTTYLVLAARTYHVSR